MRGLVGKMVMFSFLSVASIGGAGIYKSYSEELGLPSIDELADMVSWDNLSETVTSALSGRPSQPTSPTVSGTVTVKAVQPR